MINSYHDYIYDTNYYDDMNNMIKEQLNDKELCRPIFITGPSGSGKTTLLKAIMKDALSNGLSGVAFSTLDLLETRLRKGEIELPDPDYDIVAIEDWDILNNRPSTQWLILVHFVRPLRQMGKTLIITSISRPSRPSVFVDSEGLHIQLLLPEQSITYSYIKRRTKEKGLNLDHCSALYMSRHYSINEVENLLNKSIIMESLQSACFRS